MSVEPLGLIVLAGGHGRRLGGRDKALLRIDGIRLVDRVLTALTALDGPRVVVRGDLPPVEGLGVPQIPDLVPDAGPLAGIAAGLAAVADGARHAAVVAVDTPSPSVEVLRELASRRADAEAVVPVVAGRLQPLHAVYATSAAGDLAAAVAAGERRVLSALDALDTRQVTEEELVRAGMTTGFVADVDTPDDLERWGL